MSQKTPELDRGSLIHL